LVLFIGKPSTDLLKAGLRKTLLGPFFFAVTSGLGDYDSRPPHILGNDGAS